MTLSGPHNSFKYSDTSSIAGVRRNYHSFFDKTTLDKMIIGKTGLREGDNYKSPPTPHCLKYIHLDTKQPASAAVE
jgi:hypothetical protein